MALREYSGSAKSTTLVGDISAAATSITVADGTGYPTGAVGPFVVTIDAGLAGEEKVLCTSRTGNTLTVTSRGWDGTSAADHSNAAVVQHTLSATDIREANAHVNDTTGDPHPQYLTAAEGDILFLTPAEGAAAYAALGGGSTITAATAATKGLILKGAASQTANMLEVQSSAGAVLSAIEADGRLSFGATLTNGPAGAPPASASGFVVIRVAGTAYRIPFYPTV